MVFLSKYLGRADVHITDEIPLSFRWLHHPSFGLDLLFLLYRLCRLGQGLTAQVVVQVLIITIVQRLIKQPFPELLFQLLAGAPSSRVVIKETADSGVGLQYAFRFRKIGNGVQYDIVLRVQSWVLRIVSYSDGKE